MNPPLVSRSLFWRYYGSLGRLTLLNALWGASLVLVIFILKRLWAFGLPTWVGWVLSFLAFSIAVVFSTGFARVVFGVFAGRGFEWKVFGPSARRFAFRALALVFLTALPALFILNNLMLYLRAALNGSWAALGLAAMALLLLVPLLLSCVWMGPMLFFREDGVFLTLKRSFLMVLGHPGVSAMLVVWGAMLLVLYWAAPVTGLLLGGGLLLAGPSTALEKLLWGYTITFSAMEPSEVLARWNEEEAKGWRDILRPWEGRRS
jgi:hypothetical protein